MGRFQVQRSSQMQNPDFHTNIILVCCALHNMCQRHYVPFEDKWFPEPEDVAADGNIGGA